MGWGGQGLDNPHAHCCRDDASEICEHGRRLAAAVDVTALPEPADDSLRAMQQAVKEFASEAWPGLTIEVESLALAEEVGELARCVVKRHHGNRGTAEVWTAELRKEAGDVGLVLLNVASIEGFDLAEVMAERLAVILHRSLDHDPVLGYTAEEVAAAARRAAGEADRG